MSVLLILHSYLRWVVIVLLIVALIRHLIGMTGRKPFTATDKRVDLFLQIATHTQFLIGLILWFVGPMGYQLLKATGFAAAMHDPVARFWIMEHNVGMLIAVVLITIGRGVVKKPISDLAKHKRAFWLFLVAFIVMMASVPWPNRTAIHRPLFRGA